MLPNLLQSPIAIFGVLRAGMAVVNVNPLYTVRELEHQLADSGARVVIVLENFAHTLEQALPRTAVETVIVTRLGDHCPLPKRWLVSFAVRYLRRMVPAWRIPSAIEYLDVIDDGQWHKFEGAELTGDDVAFLQYTGGTTGRAKGAVLTHRNVAANMLQSAAWVRPFFSQGAGAVITALPLYHIYSLTANLLCFLELGGHNVLITNPRDLRGFVKTLRRHRFAYMTGVNTLFNALLNTRGFERLDFKPLRVAMGGGMAVQRDVAERWQTVTGVPITQGYGLTEASPVVSGNPLNATSFNGSVGLPFPSTEVEIRDDEGRVLGTNEVGEICVRGPQVMKAYWQRPEETAEVFYPDGWLKTGDVGRLDAAGYLYIEDRKKDVIVVSGFKVYPSEVEDVVTQHPGIVEAAAIGVDNEQSGEAVKLFVVRKDSSLSSADVVAYCRERLTGYKVPHLIEFVDELPKSNVGKVLRRKLKELESGHANSRQTE
jgi:long-chain acyl-CoA synthetase